MKTQDIKTISTEDLHELLTSIIDELKMRENSITGAIIGKFDHVTLFITHIPNQLTIPELTVLLKSARFLNIRDSVKNKIVIGLKNQNEIIKMQFYTGRWIISENLISVISYAELLKRASEFENIN